MGVKVKLVLACMLVLSGNVIGQDNGVLEIDRTVNAETPIAPTRATETEKEVPNDEIIDESLPVEILSDAKELHVTSGKYQALNDALVGEEPVNLQAIDFNSNNVESEKQLQLPTTTATTNNEYGKHLPVSII